jgi:PAS domain S-box-containing protein
MIKKKILIVDNNPVILSMMTNFLEKEGHQVITAEDGLFALDVMQTFIPDLMFIDLIMPNMKGDKLCQVIRSDPKFNKVYIVIFSGIVAEEDIDFSKLGANACLAKGPFDGIKKNIQLLVQQAGQKSREDPIEVMGTEGLHKREIPGELLAANHHSNMILNNIPEAIIELTREAVIVVVNSRAISLTGIEENKLLTSKFIELFENEYHRRLEKLLQKVNLQETTGWELFTLCNGKKVLLNLQPLEKKQDLTILAIIRDISEEQRLRDIAETGGEHEKNNPCPSHEPVSKEIESLILSDSLFSEEPEEAENERDATSLPKTTDLDLKLLYADDEFINREVMAGLIEDLTKWQLTTVNDGQEALQLIREDDFDMVLMDIMMPGIDGIEATRQIRANPDWNHIPIIAVTAVPEKEGKEENLSPGFDGYVSKPVDILELLAVIEKQIIKADKR